MVKVAVGLARVKIDAVVNIRSSRLDRNSRSEGDRIEEAYSQLFTPDCHHGTKQARKS